MTKFTISDDVPFVQAWNVPKTLAELQYPEDGVHRQHTENLHRLALEEEVSTGHIILHDSHSKRPTERTYIGFTDLMSADDFIRFAAKASIIIVPESNPSLPEAPSEHVKPVSRLAAQDETSLEELRRPKSNIIEIPVGTKLIEVRYIPTWIAEILSPVPDVMPQLSDLEKEIPQAEAGPSKIERLTDADARLLGKITNFFDIPPNMTQAHYATVHDTFMAAPDKPAWNLVPTFRDYNLEARIEQVIIKRAHFELLENAMKSGALQIYTKHHVPAKRIDPSCFVTIEAARVYLASIGFELREIDADPAGDVVVMRSSRQ